MVGIEIILVINLYFLKGQEFPAPVMEEHCINHIKLEGSAFLTTYSRTATPLNPGLKA